MTNSQADSGQQTHEGDRVPFRAAVYLEPDSIIFELKRLFLSGSECDARTVIAMRNFLKLENLDLSGMQTCGVSIGCAETLKKFPLRFLDVSVAQFNKHDVELLQHALPHTKVDWGKPTEL